MLEPITKHMMRAAYFSAGLGVILITLVFPLPAKAKKLGTHRCDALVSVAGNLYLVGPNGKLLTRFPSDGAAVDFVTLSPDGDKVAYAAGTMAKHITVANKFGQHGSFPLNATNDSAESAYTKAMGYLMGLTWNSDDVLRVTRFGGKDYEQFEFRHIPASLSQSAPLTKEPALADNCVLSHDRGRVACIEYDGVVHLGGGTSGGRVIFSVSGFKESQPEESLVLSAGESAKTTGTHPKFTVTLKSIGRNGIDLRVTPPGGGWWDTFLKNGGYTTTPPYLRPHYEFKVTVINAKTDQVRVDVLKGGSPYQRFGRALAWQPQGQGLLFIRYTNTQTYLDLIQPNLGDANGPSEKGQRPQWKLAAQLPISWPGKVRSMRFLTPSLLLLDTGDYRGPQYSELAIHFSNRQDRRKLSLRLGRVIPLPATIMVIKHGKTSRAPVLDWSCPSHS